MFSFRFFVKQFSFKFAYPSLQRQKGAVQQCCAKQFHTNLFFYEMRWTSSCAFLNSSGTSGIVGRKKKVTTTIRSEMVRLHTAKRFFSSFCKLNTHLSSTHFAELQHTVPNRLCIRLRGRLKHNGPRWLLLMFIVVIELNAGCNHAPWGVWLCNSSISAELSGRVAETIVKASFSGGMAASMDRNVIGPNMFEILEINNFLYFLLCETT